MWRMNFLFLQILLSLLPSASAHFLLKYPEARGFDEDKLVNFPCGGQDSPNSNRTLWPLAGGPIQLYMQHDRVALQVLLGLGDDVGVNFNITLVSTFEEEGFGDFCMGNVVGLIIRIVSFAGCSPRNGRLYLRISGSKTARKPHYRLLPAVILTVVYTTYEFSTCVLKEYDPKSRAAFLLKNLNLGQ